MARVKSIAAVLILGAALYPALLLAQDGTTKLKSGQRPVACDCTNCSAPHCQAPGPFKIQTMTSDMQNAENVPSTAEQKAEPKNVIRSK